MNASRTSGKTGKVRICVLLAVVALAGLALAVGPAMAGPAAADLQAAHAAYLTQGTALGAGSGAGAAAPAMMRAALVAARANGTMLTRGAPGQVAFVPPVAQPIGKAVPVSEPGIGSGIAALVASAALLTVGLIAGFSVRAQSRAGRAGKTAVPATLRPEASAHVASDERLRHAA